MKKLLFSLILFSIFICPVLALAGTNDNTAVFRIGNGQYNINGYVKKDVAPYIKDGRTFLPLRYVAYALGIGDNSIAWDDASNTAYIIRNGVIMAIHVGDKSIRLGDRTIYADVPAEITQNRVMLPIRAVAEAFGCNVGWDDKTGSVIIVM